MSCNACTKKYGFFCKESGCPNCGYSFCTKCLKKEIEVPRSNNKKLKVCLKCFEVLDKNKKQTELLQAENTKLNIADNQIFAITEPFEAPILEPFQSAEEALPDEKSSPDDVEIKQNLDTEITKRLAGLKTGVLLSNDKEIAERLALLKDETYKENKNSDILLSKDTRTDQEKLNDLLKQFVEENNIDKEVNFSRMDPISDIEKRLAALRGHDISSNKITYSTTNVKDESMNVSKIVQRYLEEAKLSHMPVTEEQEFNKEISATSNPDLDELPFCIICNEDAIIRCLNCDNDLYCRNCFKEIHSDEEYRLHRTKNYSVPPKFKENHF